MPDFEKLTEAVVEELERLLFNDFCQDTTAAVVRYADYISELLSEQAMTYFEQNSDKKTYKVKIRFWGGIVNQMFSFFDLDDILERKFWEVFEDDSVKVKVKIEFDDGYCIVKCKVKRD